MPETPERKSLDRPISAPAQLLVEGRTPEIFFRELVAQLGLADKIDVRTFGDVAKDTLQTYLELLTSKAAFKQIVTKLGVVRDAESHPAESGFQSVCAALAAAKLPVPAAMNAFSGTPVSIGVFIFPDCHGPGMLETLCLEAAVECEANAQPKLLPCVDAFFACVGEATVFDNITKARFAAYALARGVVDPQLGRAAQRKVIRCDANVFRPLVNFIKQMSP